MHRRSISLSRQPYILVVAAAFCLRSSASCSRQHFLLPLPVPARGVEELPNFQRCSEWRNRRHSTTAGTEDPSTSVAPARWNVRKVFDEWPALGSHVLRLSLTTRMRCLSGRQGISWYLGSFFFCNYYAAHLILTLPPCTFAKDDLFNPV
jgi:hypothetical protein